MYTIKKSRINLTMLFTALLALALFRLVSSVMLIWKYPRPAFIAAACIYGILAAAFALGILRARRCRLSFNSSDISITPFWGAPRTLSYNNLEKISMGGRSYVIYTKDGKKLCAFDDFRTENASSIVAFLKEKGIRTDI